MINKNLKPMNLRAGRLFHTVVTEKMDLQKACAFVAYALADSHDRVHLEKDDLDALIYNIAVTIKGDE